MNGVQVEILDPKAKAVSQEIDPSDTTILVVEDEDFVLEVTCEVLISAGYHVLRARTATEAGRIFALEKKGVDLLLTDVVLPGRSGQVLARELTGIHPELRTIFISGYPENQRKNGGMEPPEGFYLPKPFSVQMLLAKVSEVLDGSLATEALAKGACGSG